MPNVLITGASKGIGRATAMYLDGKGHTVFAGVRSAADGEALRKEASSRLQPVQLDVTDAAQIAQAAETVRRAVGTSGVIERALTEARPRTRYTVGSDAWIGAHIIAKLPDRVRDRLLQGR